MSIATQAANSADRLDKGSWDSALAAARRLLQAALETRTEDLDRAYQEWGIVDLRDFEIASGLMFTPPPGTDLAALFLVWDLEDPAGSRWPHKAEVLHSPERGWFVNWVLAQCTSCFGVGIVGDGARGDEICGTCGGGGWGLLNSHPYPYVPENVLAT